MKVEFIFEVRLFNTSFYFLFIVLSFFKSILPFIICDEVIAKMFVYYFQLVNIDIKCFILSFKRSLSPSAAFVCCFLN